MQYESVASCVYTLGRKEFGSWDEVWGDNVVCRFVHVGLTSMRPEVSDTVVCLLLLRSVYSEMVKKSWARILIGILGSLSSRGADRCDEVRRCAV